MNEFGSLRALLEVEEPAGIDDSCMQVKFLKTTVFLMDYQEGKKGTNHERKKDENYTGQAPSLPQHTNLFTES